MPLINDNQSSAQHAVNASIPNSSSLPGDQPLTAMPPNTPDTVASLKAKAEAGKAGDEALLRQAITQAQHVALQTKDDPFLQVQELEKLKATYMQTRYGQTIKAAEN